MYTESFKLGYLLKVLGLTPIDLERIMNGNIIITQDPKDIREYILEGCDLKVTFLRNMVNIGTDPYELARILNTDANSLIINVDNFGFWVNTLDFRVKINVNLRRELIKYLVRKEITLNAIANILDVAISTVQNDRNIG